MATPTLTTPVPKSLRDDVVRSLWKKRRACAADLANELSSPTTAAEVLQVVEELEKDGVVRPVDDTAEPRRFEGKYQAVYELTR